MRGELELADASFDVVFSLSSIEHFGSRRDVARAAAEIGRVLRPGGHAFVVTECFVASSPLDRPRVHNLLRIASRGRVAGTARPAAARSTSSPPPRSARGSSRPRACACCRSPTSRLSPRAWRTSPPIKGAERPEPASGRWHPHIALQARIGSPWTSIALALQKPG